MRRKTRPQNYINHIALVLDESSSMWSHRTELIKVVKSQIRYLSDRSQELNQETRVTIYTFANTIECVVYDMDVMRLPSIEDYYEPQGMTALVDATLKASDDLSLTPQIYGDHAFLTFVLTDGMENASSNPWHRLERRLTTLADNQTVAVLVPDQQAKFEAKRFGFPADNIAIWDTTSSRGVREVGETIRKATDSFMDGRAKGVRSSRSIFSTGVDAVNPETVKAAGLTPLKTSEYVSVPVLRDTPIKEWVEQQYGTYIKGMGFYQLTKSEMVQAQKKVAVMDKATGQIYVGRNARDMLGLPDMNVRVKPDYNPLYEIFVQSTSPNRKLIGGTRLLILDKAYR